MKTITNSQIKDLFHLRWTNPSKCEGSASRSPSLSRAIIEAKCSEGDCGGDGKHIFKRTKKAS